MTTDNDTPSLDGINGNITPIAAAWPADEQAGLNEWIDEVERAARECEPEPVRPGTVIAAGNIKIMETVFTLFG